MLEKFIQWLDSEVTPEEFHELVLAVLAAFFLMLFMISQTILEVGAVAK